MKGWPFPRPSRLERRLIDFADRRARASCTMCDGYGMIGSSGDTICDCDECGGYGWQVVSTFWNAVCKRLWAFWHWRTELFQRSKT